MAKAERDPNRSRPRTNGRYIADPAQATLDAQAAAMRSRAMSYRAIGEQLGVGTTTAFDMVERATAAVRREGGELVVAFESEKLDRAELECEALEEAAHRILAAHHVVVQFGKVIYLLDDNGDPATMEDHGPVLAAIETLRRLKETRVRISESRRKLLGADAAQKIDTTATVKYTYEGVSTDDV